MYVFTVIITHVRLHLTFHNIETGKVAELVVSVIT
jgi:hypothetical protein